jgi:putative protease
MASKPKKVGQVTHFYDKISVAIVKLSSTLKVGDTIHFQGNATDFTQAVDSMQYDHQDLPAAKKGQEVGIKVSEKVRDGDQVLLVE